MKKEGGAKVSHGSTPIWMLNCSLICLVLSLFITFLESLEHNTAVRLFLFTSSMILNKARIWSSVLVNYLVVKGP